MPMLMLDGCLNPVLNMNTDVFVQPVKCNSGGADLLTIHPTQPSYDDFGFVINTRDQRSTPRAGAVTEHELIQLSKRHTVDLDLI